VVFYRYSNLYYSSEEIKIRSNWLFWKKWYALAVWDAQVVNRLETPGLDFV